MMRSDKPYEVSEDGLNEVLKRVSRCKGINDRERFIQFSHQECKDILMPLATFIQGRKYGLGALDVLPNELIQNILTEHIDFESLVYFRQVNRWAREFVQLMPKYGIVLKSSIELIPALLRTSFSQKFTLQDMFELLRTPGCGICHDRNATLVYVPGLMRICTKCPYRLENRDIRMIRLSVACKLLGMESEELGEVVGIMRRPNTRGTDKSLYGRGIIPWRIVKEMYWTHRKSLPALARPLMLSLKSNMDMYDATALACCRYPVAYDLRRSRISHTVLCEGCVKLEDARKRRGSSESLTSSVHDDLSLYYEHEFLLHFRGCRPAQILYEVSDERKAGRIAELLNRERWCGRFAANAGPHVKEMKKRRKLARVIRYLWDNRMVQLGLLQRAG